LDLLIKKINNEKLFTLNPMSQSPTQGQLLSIAIATTLVCGSHIGLINRKINKYKTGAVL